MAATPSNTSGPAAMSSGAQDAVVEHEAYQFWGYLFKPDKTGTDRLKSLLRGLKDVMNANYEPSENPDLTPNQLAYFYRELHGNYDQLFLGTPSESIAFIYKSLGCLHSLQPLSHSTAFTDPSVPALKTEGWIMWQTIQLLLGPDEHSSFLMEAVQQWDIKDPMTGEIFPKILPRQCFPMEADKHMVAWYEGVSERLRREAEEEERQREMEAEQAEVRRLHAKREDTDDEGSVDSRGPALAYFRNPLYRHLDGRPSIVRHNSKRPTLSPRPTMMGRSKEAASTVGHVFRNIGSPHLWDGRGGSKDRDRDRRRRSSLPPSNSYAPEPPTSAGYDPRLEPGYEQQSRRRSAQVDRPDTASTEESWERVGNSPVHSPRPGSQHHHSHRDEYDPALRHSRSHEPTPSQKEYGDYFEGYDHDPSQRRNSAHDSTGTPPTPNGIGHGFAPSQSPLFAARIAKQPQPRAQRPPPAHSGPPRPSPSMRRAQERPYSRSPDPGMRHGERDDRDLRRFASQSQERRPRFDQSPAPSYNTPPPGSAHSVGPLHQPGFPPVGGAPRDSSRPTSAAPSSASGYPHPSSQHGRDRRSGNTSSGDVSHSGTEDRDARRSRPKKTRFAAGVDGRRYPNESPWR